MNMVLHANIRTIIIVEIVFRTLFTSSSIGAINNMKINREKNQKTLCCI